MKNKLLYLLLFTLINLTYGQTNVNGGLFSDTTWNIDGSPYVVTADVALFPGHTLTIEPGVIVKFNSGTKLIVRGTLLASGSSGSEITFTSSMNSPTKGSWVGIELENNQGGKIIASNIIGEYADNFIRIMNSSSGEILNINNSEIKNCNRAFYGYDSHSTHSVVLDNLNVNNNNYGFIYAQNVTLTNSVFSDGEKGIHCWENIPNMLISNSEFFNFSVWPFNMEGEINNCHIYNNAVGIRMKPNLIVKNSTIEFNTIGIEVNYPNQMSGSNIFNNKICDNTDYNFKHLYSYPITISNNCWCSNDENEINDTIFDAYDDINLGIVTYTPYDSTCTSTLSIETYINNLNELSTFPNPTSGKITLSKNIKGKYEIYSLNGVLISHGILTKEININALNQGLYLLKIFEENSGKYSIMKIIKK